MSEHHSDEFATDTDHTTTRPGQLSPNGHWIFGSIFAGLTLIGFGFGVWAGASKPKPPEVAVKEKDKEKDNTDKPKAVTPQPQPNPPQPTPPQPEPKKNPDPMPMTMTPEPEPKPEPKKNPPDVTPKPKDTEPKTPPVKAVAFSEVEKIIKASCIDCHGAPGRKPGGGVDLRNVDAILNKKGDPVVIPGKPEKSRLYLSITEGTMPEAGSGKPVPTPEQLETIKNWILSGAK